MKNSSYLINRFNLFSLADVVLKWEKGYSLKLLAIEGEICYAPIYADQESIIKFYISVEFFNYLNEGFLTKKLFMERLFSKEGGVGI